MNRKTATILFNITAALVALYLIVTAINKKQITEYTGDCPSLPLSNISQKEIDEVVIAQGEQSVTLQKEEDSWVIIGEQRSEVDQQKVDQFFTNLADSSCAGLASANPDNYDKFNLDEKSRQQVTLKKQGQEVLSFYLGKVGMAAGTTYIKTLEGDKVYTLKSRLRTSSVADEKYWQKEEKTED